MVGAPAEMPGLPRLPTASGTGEETQEPDRVREAKRACPPCEVEKLRPREGVTAPGHSTDRSRGAPGHTGSHTHTHTHTCSESGTLPQAVHVSVWGHLTFCLEAGSQSPPIPLPFPPPPGRALSDGLAGAGLEWSLWDISPCPLWEQEVWGCSRTPSIAP